MIFVYACKNTYQYLFCISTLSIWHKIKCLIPISECLVNEECLIRSTIIHQWAGRGGVYEGSTRGIDQNGLCEPLMAQGRALVGGDWGIAA